MWWSSEEVWSEKISKVAIIDSPQLVAKMKNASPRRDD